MDILSRAAEAFNRLLSISYSFFIVDKGCKSEIILNFAAGNFLHLSGIHYLAGNMYRDKKRFFEDVLRGRILYSDLWKTAQKSNMPVPYDIESRISLLATTSKIFWNCLLKNSKYRDTQTRAAK